MTETPPPAEAAAAFSLSVTSLSEWLREATAFDIATLIGTAIAIIQFAVWVGGAGARQKEKADTLARAERAEAERDALKKQVEALMAQSTEQTGLVRDLHDKLDRQFRRYIARAESGETRTATEQHDIDKAEKAVFEIARTSEAFEEAIETVLSGDEAGFYTLIREAEQKQDYDLWIRIAQIARFNFPRIAIRALEEAAKLRPGDPGLRYELAKLYGTVGRIKDARTELEAIAGSAAGDRALLAGVFFELGLIAEQERHVDEAVQYLTRARALYNELGAPVDELDALSMLTEIAVGQDDPHTAQAYYEDARALVSGISDTEARMNASNSLGLLCETLNRHAEAESHYSTALRLSRELGNRSAEAYQLASLSELALVRSNLDDAIKHGLAALKLHMEGGDKAPLPQLFTTVGDAYQKKGDLAQAHTCYSRALALSEDLGHLDASARILESLGRLSKKEGNLPQAILNHEKSLQIRERLSDPAGEYLSLYELRQLADEIGKRDQACTYGRRQLDLGRKLGKDTSYVESWLKERGCPD
jgi:tetratricopeptide (TPR) repeat protein